MLLCSESEFNDLVSSPSMHYHSCKDAAVVFCNFYALSSSEIRYISGCCLQLLDAIVYSFVLAVNLGDTRKICCHYSFEISYLTLIMRFQFFVVRCCENELLWMLDLV
ncbi:hypothetical protein SAY86_016926 [Trapa natans]|uniref:Uncharacterized protein n=1 Tax=Trapa natans TaxID=22666 RepID=A0AAN7M0N1_TRANT|nr:hypothetical protein SAY86_016926 [Trapa natans]